jgi:hypothetical protein
MSQNQDSIKTILEAHAAINRIVNDVKGKYPADVAIIQEQINNPFFNNAKSTAVAKEVKDQNAASLKAAEITVSAIKKATTVAGVDNAVAIFNKYKYQGNKGQVQAEAEAKKASLRTPKSDIEKEIESSPTNTVKNPSILSPNRNLAEIHGEKIQQSMGNITSLTEQFAKKSIQQQMLNSEEGLGGGARKTRRSKKAHRRNRSTRKDHSTS